MKRKPRHSTVSKVPPPSTKRPPLPPSRRRPGPPPPRARVARLIDDRDASLLDVIDSLLNKGVVLNADIILALADVDLIYMRLSALLCAADRIFSKPER
jgi:hypothetical protein